MRASNIVVTYSPKAQPALHLFPGSTSSSKKITNKGIILFSSNHHQPGTKDLMCILNATCQNQQLKTKKATLLSELLLKTSYYHTSQVPVWNLQEQSDFYVPIKWTIASVDITVKAETTKLDVS